MKSSFKIGCEDYSSMGTWFLNNWIMTSMKCEEEAVGISELKDNSVGLGESGAILSANIAFDKLACNTRNVNLTQFSIVGRSGGTRKRPRGSRTGCWWSATRWSPGCKSSGT